MVDQRMILAGNRKLMEKMKISYDQGELAGTVVYVAVDNQYAGYILIADEVKEDSARAIKELKAANISKTIMLTGDSKKIGEKVAGELGIDQVYAELLPTDKVRIMEELLAQKSAKGKLAYVGDGINDAPVLARADIGIAMGGLGSDAAIEAADIVIMTDEPSKIAAAMKIAKKTLKIATQNTIFAIGVKVIVLILSAMGFASMWAAVFADVGVTVLAVINSFRALQVKNI
jgi:Cd2+/Zn2+-exporting ATPase